MIGSKLSERLVSANEITTNDEIRYENTDDDSGWVGVADSSENPIREKSYRFALTVIKLYSRTLERKEYVISKQLLRSGTGIGANVEEAIAAESRRDFIHKMALASKEARETVYWLRLLSDSDLVPDLDVSSELSQARELVRMLTSIVKTTALKSKA
jgi:four helix bundle protein